MSPRALSLLLPVILLALSATPALAGWGSTLTITVDRPIAVVVDGEILEFIEGTMNVEVYDISPGLHTIEFRKFGGKLADEAEVQVPGGGKVLVRARWRDQKFELIDTVFVDGPPPPTQVIVIEERPVHTEEVHVELGVGGLGTSGSVSTTTSTTSVTTSLGGGGMYGEDVTVTTTETTETVHVDDGHTEVVIIEEAPPGTRQVTFRVTDDSWANVYLDGKKVWEPRAMAGEKTITVSTGEHRLTVKDFMDDDVWSNGTLVVDGWTDLIIGITEEAQVEVFNDSDAFYPR